MFKPTLQKLLTDSYYAKHVPALGAIAENIVDALSRKGGAQ